jgi:hypothetical protein
MTDKDDNKRVATQNNEFDYGRDLNRYRKTITADYTHIKSVANNNKFLKRVVADYNMGLSKLKSQHEKKESTLIQLSQYLNDMKKFKALSKRELERNVYHQNDILKELDVVAGQLRDFDV